MNGAAVNQYRPSTGKCYTIATANNVSACAYHATGSTGTNTFVFNYNYTN